MKKNSITKSLKYILIAILFIAFVLSGTTMGLTYTYVKEAPPLDMNNFLYAQPSVILDEKGQFYEELQGKEKREIVTVEEIPKHVLNAFIAIEDERFYEHSGVDIKGISRAALHGLKSGNLTSAGGSTITQQLIKLTHLSPKKELSRKIKEAYLAIQLEKTMDKDKILEAYLNKINFAYAHGIQAASKTYFRKGVDELSIAQAAILAAIPKAPTTYKPYIIEKKEDESFAIAVDNEGKVVHSLNNEKRALTVLSKMNELGFINEKQYQEAKAQIKNNDFGLTTPLEPPLYSYFTDAVYEQVLKDLIEEYYSGIPEEEAKEKAADYLLNGGLTIASTIDSNIQSILEENFKNDSLFPKQSSRAQKASQEKSKELGREVNYTPEGAMVIIENSTGKVKGIVGGRHKQSNLSMNRALRSFQPGSATKPLTVYAPGLEEKTLTLANTYNDAPINVKGYKPRNAGGGYSGITTVRNALYKSINTVAVQAWQDVGLENSVKYGEKFGLSIVKEGSHNDMVPAALSLGGYTHGQTPLAMASAFSTFPNQGKRVSPTFYTKVVDSTGKIVLEHESEEIDVISPQTAYLMTDVLKDVPKGGTTNLSVPGVNIAGKTGTTNENMHAWFVGYTPYYSAAVWYGYDENHVVANGRTYYLNIGIYGGSKPGPASMWEKVMTAIHKGLPAREFPSMPRGIVTANAPYGELFIQGTVPKYTAPPKSPDTSEDEKEDEKIDEPSSEQDPQKEKPPAQKDPKEKPPGEKENPPETPPTKPEKPKEETPEEDPPKNEEKPEEKPSPPKEENKKESSQNSNSENKKLE
ncbi:transglycosylase domain-containing protein [Irregularibacter muris]|uniref:Penicillin-binding protein 1A n=1 Tax=Irregularibacter muris TaxID=1796619 RepID=A0AAE3HFN7_9FIRM|nr:transglycosylase domain-containing protein [Irregularibacter muris]MCR1897728.1 transglycosylase domain-containing protein [Irregularibacter muris]